MARRVMIPVRCGLIQVIHLEWDKSARGGPGARDRTAVPQAFPLDLAQFAGASGLLCVETTHWGNRNGFTEPICSRHEPVAVGEEFRHGCVSVSAHKDGLLVRFQYSGLDAGAPNRWYFNRAFDKAVAPDRGLLARAGDWVRVCYNGRFSGMDDGNWWYHHVTVNVAWFESEPNGRIFFDQKPAHELRVLGNLW